jgi:cyclopropane fatty-acyl-phospholipid synthase-like methyltransferase
MNTGRFKRSSKYSTEWMKNKEMGPNAVWLTEYLTEKIKFKPGMKVLDLGCGKAMSSIFLAKEFGVYVWATDLWISPTDNYTNIKEQGVTNLVYPIYAEAHALPFAEQFFDVIISVDAYHYFGTDDTYFLYILKFLKRGGIIGIIVPGLQKEIGNKIPVSLQPYWEPELHSLHTAEWWKNHWGKTGLVEIIVADLLPEGWKIWYEWENEIVKTRGIPKERGSDLELLKADNGEYLCFPRIIAKKK